MEECFIQLGKQVNKGTRLHMVIVSCGRSEEYHLLSAIKHQIMPPCLIKFEQINDIS